MSPPRRLPAALVTAGHCLRQALIAVAVQPADWPRTWPQLQSRRLLALLAALLVAGSLCAAAGQRLLQHDPAYRARRFDNAISAAARHHLPASWDWRLYKALIAQESAFDPRAHSAAGARGLAQLMSGTAAEQGLRPRARYNPRANLAAGARTLAHLWAAWPGLAPGPRQRLTLAAYNAGLGSVRRAIAQAGGSCDWAAVAPHLPAETQAYVTAILAHHYPQVCATTPAYAGYGGLRLFERHGDHPHFWPRRHAAPD